MTSRVGKVTGAFKKPCEKSMGNDKLRIKTKVFIYQRWVLSTLLYGSETWTLYAGQEGRSNSFHVRCLRNVLKIKWQDRIPDSEELKRVGTQSIYPYIQSCGLGISGGLGMLRAWITPEFPNRYYIWGTV